MTMSASLRPFPTAPAVLGRISAPQRKPDVRTEAAELRVELTAERAEHHAYARAVAIANGRVLRLIEGGQPFAAAEWARQIAWSTDRRLRQTDPEGTAA